LITIKEVQLINIILTNNNTVVENVKTRVVNLKRGTLYGY